MKSQHPFFTTLLAASALLQMSGCSFAFPIIGAIGDAGDPDEYTFTPSGVDSIKQGTAVEVLRKDGSTVAGDFVKSQVAQMPSLADSLLDPTGAMSSRTDSATIMNSEILVFTSTGSTQKIPVNDILRVRQPVVKNGVAIGVCLGMVADVTIIIAISNAMKGFMK